MSDIQIRVGASLDRSTATVFSQLAESAKRANRAVEADAKRAATSESQAWRQASRDLERMAREVEREKARANRETAASAKSAARQETQEWKAAEREISRMAREASRERVARERDDARARSQIRREEAQQAARDLRAQENAIKQHQKSVAAQDKMMSAGLGLAGRGAMALGRFGMGILGDVAAGAGVNLSFGQHVANAQQLQQMAVQLSNAGYMPGDNGPNAKRVDPNELAQEAYRIGSQTGTSANDVMSAMQTMVGRTGDLQAARDSMGEIAKLSMATGSSLEDMAAAAGDVSNQLGDIPDKGKIVNEVMRSVAGQGKLGAVEIKDLANQMAKVAANANLMEGNAADNIKLFGAFAQEARQRGGAASPQQAATSVTAMMDTFSKGARLHAFANLGIRTSGEGGKIRNVQEILIESLQKTQHKSADQTNEAFGALFASSQARRSVRGFESIFRSTYASTSGDDAKKLAAATKAVNDEFDRLKNVAISQEELNESFAREMATGKAQANQFNNELQKTAGEMANSLYPALVALAPTVLSATKSFADFMADTFGVKATVDNYQNQKDAEKGQKAVLGLMQHGGEGFKTEEDWAKAAKTLQGSSARLGTAITTQRTSIEEKKKEGQGVLGFLSDALIGTEGANVEKHGLVGGTAKTLFATGGLGFIQGGRQYGKMREKNIAAEEQDLAKTEASKKSVDDQLKELQQMHQVLKGGVINVKVVDMPKQAAGVNPPNAPKPQNEGLAPNE